MSEQKKLTLDQYDELNRVRDEVSRTVNRLLYVLGWEHTSHNPGGLWLWQKVLPDGRVALVDQSTALHFEEVWMEADDEQTDA